MKKYTSLTVYLSNIKILVYVYIKSVVYEQENDQTSFKLEIRS
jgi:hypothetical protein